MPVRVEFAFKGKRQYVTGADIFNATVGRHPPALLRNVHFTIHGIVRSTSCELHESDSPASLDFPEVRARARFDVDRVTRWAALIESTSASTSRREEYPEDRVTSLCRIKDEHVVLDNKSPFTFIETIVAMNKYLHQKLFGDVGGQWMFTGIDLTLGCNARERIALQVDPRANYRLTRAVILLENKPIGSLFFSLVKS